MKNFAAQWKAMEDKKKADAPEVPKITKALPVIKWTEAFRDYLHRMIGVGMALISRKESLRGDDVRSFSYKFGYINP
jgi:hypothetical protein